MITKYKILLCALVISTSTYAQSNYELFMMTQQNTQGSCRSMALGGASASLGGDFTGVVNNPATLGIYRTGQMGLTMGIAIDHSCSEVQSEEYLDQRVRFSFNQLFFVGTNVKSVEKKNISSFSWGVGINRVSNFNKRYSYYLENNQNSFADALAYDYNNGGDQNRALYAWDVAILDSVGNLMTKSFDQNGNPIGQNQNVEYRGSLTEINLSGAYNYENKVMFGLGVGVPLGFMSRSIKYIEQDANSAITNFNNFTYVEDSRTSIAGVNAKLGLLFQPQSNIRIGAYYQSPTSYSMNDTFYYHFISDMEGYAGLWPGAQSEDYLGESDYNMRGASKYGLSGTYLFGTKGLITLDYLRQNPQNNKMFLFADDPQLETEINKSLKNSFRGTNTFKLGLEARLTSLYLRVGGNYTNSPYQEGGSNLGETYGFSIGIGGRSKSSSFDLTYVRQTTRTTDEPYYSGYSEYEAHVTQNVNRIVFSIGLR